VTDCSILRVYFWFGDRYALSLLFQSILMIAVQVPPPYNILNSLVSTTQNVSGLPTKSRLSRPQKTIPNMVLAGP